MRNFANNLFRWYYQRRYSQIELFVKEPVRIQQAILKELLQGGLSTEWGKRHNFADIKTYKDFARQIPIQSYETLHPYIERMMLGESDVLWEGQVKMFSKSSGTTSAKSKFIPVSKANLRGSHIKGTWDTMTLLYNRRPDSKIFSGKNFLMAGSNNNYSPFPETIYGDVSALMIKNMPYVARPFFEPDIDVVLQDDWEAKIENMVKVAIHEDVAEQIKMVGGVPTWTIVFFRKILEATGKDNVLEVWKNFETYIHGGVGLAPYKEQLHQLLPSKQVNYWEVYNASEGYFASQYELDGDDMLLLLDNGTFFEFLPASEWDSETPIAIPLEEVELGVNYAMVISTNSGLWRYMIGDTVMFTSKYPYKIKITGRVQQFINAFGEEVIVANADQAIRLTCDATNAIVAEYTAGPIYMEAEGQGGHEWIVEFERAPASFAEFTTLLDQNMQRLNSDYEAKRYKNIALKELELRAVPPNTFLDWLRSRGKYGNQNKVPRLANHRKYIEAINQYLNEKVG